MPCPDCERLTRELATSDGAYDEMERDRDRLEAERDRLRAIADGCPVCSELARNTIGAHETNAEPAHRKFQNPATQVMFRAGLLAARESLARFVATDSPTIAQSIRANWWPTLCPDPGVPRRHKWDEVAEGGEEGPWKAKPLTPEQEALPEALVFLIHYAGCTLEEYEPQSSQTETGGDGG